MRKDKGNNMKLVKIFFLFFLTLLFLNAAKAYDDNGTYFTCYNCTDCMNAINNNTYNKVILGTDINSSTTCINNPAQFSNKIFDCNNHKILGSNSGYGILVNLSLIHI